MPVKSPFLTCCFDSNVLISAIAFGGKPLRLVERLIDKDFSHVTGPNILQEARRNLVGKLGMNPGRVDRLLNNIASVSAVKVPKGRVHIAGYAPNDLVLEGP